MSLASPVLAGLGLIVCALAADGTRPIGRGIGPALELRDVRMVLGNDAGAPADLRDKAQRFAARILSFDPAVGTKTAGLERARELLQSGAAANRFAAIVASQGAVDPIRPASLTHVVRAADGGSVTDVDGWRVAGIARRAGAPADKSAGIDLANHLAVVTGSTVPAGTVSIYDPRDHRGGPAGGEHHGRRR